MKKFYLIHGFETWPNRGFLPWLMSQLFQKARYFAVALEMPNPELPKTEEWVQKIKQELGEPSLNKYLVGHSLGVPAILRYLEALPEGSKIGGVFLVAGFVDKLNDSVVGFVTHQRINNFIEKPFDFEHIKKVCRKFFIIHGEKDTVVTLPHAKILAEKLGVKPLVIKGAGHFQSSKVFELPELLELILKEIK